MHRHQRYTSYVYVSLLRIVCGYAAGADVYFGCVGGNGLCEYVDNFIWMVLIGVGHDGSGVCVGRLCARVCPGWEMRAGQRSMKKRKMLSPGKE
ncbi:hypothetical protein CC78DRAFT_72328 [Lojkania enalia]|uniref:Uncharacterized protein n=1 Tax=Lojkania enalia TaxID=147567 RepID=A0A9P4JYM0_9PLEO|nr:hypothetical protein CC78DRAFT_72328 [Didymosphaeria enalia]